MAAVSTTSMRPLTPEQQAEQDAMNAAERGPQTKMAAVVKMPVEPATAKMAEEPATAKMAAVPMPGQKEREVSGKKRDNSGGISSVTTAVNNLNTTINNLLTAIESRMKKNNVNDQLKKMTDFISQINDSLPAPASGGGTRRANIKKHKKTLRRRVGMPRRLL